VEVSDIIQGLYYIDKKCHELKEILEKHGKYTECIVKRWHWRGDWEDDIIVIQEPNGEILVEIWVWELDALTPSELISYIEFGSGPEVEVERAEDLAALMISISLLALIASFIFFLSSWGGTLQNPMFQIMLVSTFLSILFTMIYRSIRSKRMKRRRELARELAQKDPDYIAALRKLVSLKDISQWMKTEYRKRLGDI
jgi:hypothetical protein